MAQLSRVAYLMTTARMSSAVDNSIAAPFTRVNGPADDAFSAAIAGAFNGWSVDSVSAIADDTEFTADRQGYDTNGSPVTYPDESLWVTRKVNQPYPNQTTPSTSTYALSDYIYSTDTVAGSVTNNSDFLSPKPVANWAMKARGVVGDTISSDSDPIEVVAFHRNARNRSEVACVIFHISDGINPTIDVAVSGMTKSVQTTDRNSVLVYRLPATDISSLNAGVITVNASVYPWIGASGSVLHSADSSVARDFSPRYYQKNTTLAASPYYVCVNTSTGNNTTGAVDQIQANAEAAPCLDIQGAIKRLTAVLGATTGVDGAFIVLDNGAHILTSTGANQTQKIGRLTVTTSSTASKASCFVEGGAAAVSFALGVSTLTAPVTTGCIRFKGVTLRRNGAQPLLNGTTGTRLEIQIEDCDYTANGTGGTSPLIGPNSDWYVTGLNNTAAFPGGLSANSNGEYRLMRGLNFDLDTRNLEPWLNLGSSLSDTSGFANLSASRGVDGAIIAFNDIRRMSSNSTWSFTLTSGTSIMGFVNSYNLFEWTTVTSGHSFSMSNDSASYGNYHVIEHHNTYIGTNVQGRCNMFYEDGVTARFSRMHSTYGNIFVGIYHKGDIFVTTSNRISNWAYKYAVGCAYNAMQYRGNEAVGYSAPQSQVWPGRGTTTGVTWNIASQTTPIDFKFTNPLGVTPGPVAGAGGGTYTLLSDSPVKNMVLEPIRPYTLDGVAVGTFDNAGAYSAA